MPSATHTSVEILQLVHSLMLHAQEYLCLPIFSLTSTVPWRFTFQRVLWRVKCPNWVGFWWFVTDKRGSSYPVCKFNLSLTKAFFFYYNMQRFPKAVVFKMPGSSILFLQWESQLSHSYQRIDTTSDCYNEFLTGTLFEYSLKNMSTHVMVLIITAEEKLLFIFYANIMLHFLK